MEILSHRMAYDLVWNKNVVILSDPCYQSYHVKMIKARAKSYVHIVCHDIPNVREGLVAPSVEMIKLILDFSEKNDVDFVCCYAGISRSSAAAYIILCSKYSPEEAIKHLDKSKHRPNERIVKIGTKLLKNEKIRKVYEEWLTNDEPCEIMSK